MTGKTSGNDGGSRRACVIVTVVVALLVALAWWADARLTRDVLDAPEKSSDFVNITAYQTKIAEPDLFPRDYLFHDPAGAKQYTPGYRIPLAWLTGAFFSIK